MFLQLIWFTMMAAAVIFAGLERKNAQILPALLAGCENAISLTLKLGAGYLLFCGLMEMAKAAGIPQMLEKRIRPLMRRLMPDVRTEETRQAIALNLSMNMLGLGNAATPLGVEAVRRLDAEANLQPEVRHDLYMLLILNATSIQLLPTTVLTLRMAAGSANANAILMPTLLCTAVSTFVGTALAVLLRKWGKRA